MLIRKTLYVGLLDYLIKFAERNDLEIEYKNDVVNKTDVTNEQIQEYVETLNLHGRGNPIEVRDYQVDAIAQAIYHNRLILLSPTGSGKSLIIYALTRLHLDRGRKCLIVVPSTSLVEQLYSDFQDYSSANGWDTEEHCQKLYSGFSKDFGKDVLLTTWQSIFRQPKSWFDQFDVLFGDEAHQFKAISLTSIMEKLTETKYRVGTTGSLDDSKINKLILEGVFGPVYKVTTTRKLMDENKLADLKITAIILKYDEAIRKEYAKATYQQEMDFIVRNEKRNKFIRNLTLSTQGNTLLLFQYVEKDGRPLVIYWYDGSYQVPRPTELEAEREFKTIGGAGAYLIGEKGTILHGSHGAGGMRIIPEAKMQAYKRPPQKYPRIKEGHYKNFLNAVRENHPAGSPFEYGARLSEVGLLGVIASRIPGKRLLYDSAGMRFTNSEDATRLLHPVFRTGWKLDC